MHFTPYSPVVQIMSCILLDIVMYGLFQIIQLVVHPFSALRLLVV